MQDNDVNDNKKRSDSQKYTLWWFKWRLYTMNAKPPRTTWYTSRQKTHIVDKRHVKYGNWDPRINNYQRNRFLMRIAPIDAELHTPVLSSLRARLLYNFHQLRFKGHLSGRRMYKSTRKDHHWFQNGKQLVWHFQPMQATHSPIPHSRIHVVRVYNYD